MKIVNIQNLSFNSDEPLENYEIDLSKDMVNDEAVSSVYIHLCDGYADFCDVYGQISEDAGPDSWDWLSMIRMSDLSVVHSIESQGIYMLPVEGLTAIRINAGGEGSIIVKAVK